MKKIILVFSTISLLASAYNAVAAAPPRPEVWIKTGIHSANLSPVWKAMRDDTGDPWAPGAPWQSVLEKVKVVGVSPGAIQGASGPELQAAFSGMKRAHVMLALGTGLLTRSDRCQAHNEAMGAPGEFEQMLLKIQRNGGELRYIVMDEPYYFGHTDASGCHQSAADLAANVAQSVATARRIFQNVVLGDVEVLNASRSLTQEIVTWADAYRAATGEKLAFMFTDIQWSELAMRNLQPLSTELRNRGIPLGIVYDADGDVQTDEAWGRSTESHIAEIEGPLGIHPDIVSFDSWTAHPRRYLPENEPWTFTNVALRYFRKRSDMQIALRGFQVTGRLTDEAGRPVAGTDIEITALDIGARMGPMPRHFEGIVPQGAATAVVGIRVGIEGACVCAGPAGAIVGGIRYKEKGTGKPEQDVSPVNVPIQGSPASVRTLALVPGQTYSPNFRQFPVTTGAPYSLDTSIAATAAAEHAGYITIIFLDASGKGLKREFVWFTPSVVSLGTVQTGADGGFHLQLPAAIEIAQPEIRALYSGNESQRPASAVAPSLLTSANVPALGPSLFGKKSPLTMLFMRSDFAPMFADAALTPQARQQWDPVASRVQVVYFSGGGITKMSDEELARMVRELQARHIGLGLEILATNWFHQRPCGQGVEGFIDPGSANAVVAKLLKAGATVEQIGMDEPLWFGHFYKEKNACQSSISELASRVAVIVKIYTAAFPNVVVGDVEPFPAVSKQPNWRSAYANWVKAFNSTVGTPLSFLRLDFNWGDESLSADGKHNVPDSAHIADLARQVVPVARENGLLADMIVDGGGAPVAQSDGAWMQQAGMHVHALEASGIHFDHVLFESWDKFPARTLPETDSNALSSLLTFYREY